MDVSSLSSLASAIPPDGGDQSVQIAVLKKALDASASSAQTLINSVPLPQKLPDYLGRNINTTA